MAQLMAWICDAYEQPAYEIISSNPGKEVEKTDGWVKSVLKTGKANIVKGLD